MIIKTKRTKNFVIYIFHNGIEIFHIDSGFKKFFIGHTLNEAKIKFKSLLKIEME